jgi:drug/metabolite transporter (DMT)-like permease
MVFFHDLGLIFISVIFYKCRMIYAIIQAFMFFIILMNCCFAAALPLLKYALAYIDPFLLVIIRMVGAGIILCTVQIVLQPQGFRARLNWPLLLANSALSMCLLCMLEAWALQDMSATKANLMWATLPLLTAVAMRLWYRHPLILQQGIAIGLGMLGVICLVMPDILTTGSLVTCSASLWYDIAMLGAVAAAAGGYLCTEQLVAEGHPVILSNGISMLGGGILSLFSSYAVWGKTCFNCTNTSQALFFISLIIFIVNIVGLSLQMWLTRTNSVILLALSSFITPLCGALFGLLQGDIWSNWLLGAALCIGSGLYILHYYDTKRVPHVSSH